MAVAGAGVWWAWPRIAQHFIGAFDFEPLDDPMGFRCIVAGETSGMPSPLLGLDAPDAPDAAIPEAVMRADLCSGLLGEPPAAGVVVIASFSDYNCPFCRVLTKRLSDLESRSGGDMRITWHELPMLGPTLISAARAALAADMQGAYAAFHKRLMRGRSVATPEFLALLARDIGVDGDRLLSDMESDAVSDRLRNTETVARIFGFIGTPALVVGGTIVVGTVSEAVIAALVEQERRDGPPPVCSP
jgi:protein-disulfide isomerase